MKENQLDEQQTQISVTEEQVSENSRKHFKYRSNECLNCGQPLDLSDRYCPYCSQLNSNKPLKLGDFVREFFSNIISYDSRLRFTIVDLLFKPGVISKNYISGKRLRYTNPFRFFLSVSIVYFLIYSLITFIAPDYNAPFVNFSDDIKEGSDNYKDETDTSTTTYSAEKSKDTVTTKYNVIEKNEVLKDTLGDDLWVINGDTIYNKKQSYPKRVARLDTMNRSAKIFFKFQIFRDFYKDKEIKNADQALDSLHIEKTRLNKWLYSKNKSLDHIGDSPKDFVSYLFSKVPFFVFFFAPIYALFFWLLYMRRNFTYMEHLVFIFHIFSFTFLALIIAIIPDVLMDEQYITQLVLVLIGPIYFFLALRKFYGQSHIKTAIKFILLNIFFFISSMIAALFFFAGTAALY